MGCALALLGLHAWPSLAAAQSIVLRRPALHWVRSDDAMTCVDPRTLAEHVEALVGPVLVRPSEAEHSIEGQVEHARPGVLRVRVRVLDALGNKVGERQLEQAAGDCGSLTPAIVFVIGMAIDPEVAAHGLPPGLMAMLKPGDRPPEQTLLNELERAPPAVTQPSLEPASADAPPSAPPREPAPTADRTGYQAALLVRNALREAPRSVLSVDAHLMYTFRTSFSLAMYLRAGGQLGEHEFRSDRGLRLALMASGALGCLGQSSAQRRLRVHGCLGAEVSLAVGSGSGFTAQDTTESVARVGLVAQISARLRLRGAFGVAAFLSGRLLAAGGDFVFKDPEKTNTVYRFPALSAGIALGPTYEF